MSATGYKLSTGADLNTVFSPYVSGSQAAATGYQLSTGADLNTVFSPYVSGTQAAATGYQIAGGADLNTVFRIPGWTWNALGSGLNGTVRAIAVLDSSNIFVGGNFTAAGGVSNAKFVAKWNNNNSTWTALGSGTDGQVNAIAVLDASNIFVGGNFTVAGGVLNTKFVAKWNNNNSTWTALTSGLSQNSGASYTPGVYTIACLNSTNIFIGGQFDTVNGGTVTSFTMSLLRWNNIASAWSYVLTGWFNAGPVLCIAILDSSNIFISGAFSNTPSLGGGIGIFKYNNVTNQSFALGSGVANSDTATTQPVWSISILDSSNVFVGGVFANATRADNSKVPNTTNIARWNNNTQVWSAVGSGMRTAATDATYSVYNICAVDTSTIFVGGNFPSVNSITNTSYMAMWNNNTSSWQALSEKPNNNVWSCYKFNNTTIFVGSDFTASGNITNKISKYVYL